MKEYLPNRKQTWLSHSAHYVSATSSSNPVSSPSSSLSSSPSSPATGRATSFRISKQKQKFLHLYIAHTPAQRRTPRSDTVWEHMRRYADTCSSSKTRNRAQANEFRAYRPSESQMSALNNQLIDCELINWTEIRQVHAVHFVREHIVWKRALLRQ